MSNTPGNDVRGQVFTKLDDRNWRWGLLGGGLVLVSVVGVTSLIRAVSDQVEVAVAAQAIAEGQILSTADVRSASLSVGDGVAVLSPNDARFAADGLLVSTGPIGVGEVLSEADFVAVADDQRRTVVGVVLGPGGYPKFGLVEQTRVMILKVGSSSAGTGPPGEIGEAFVLEVASVGGSESLLVTLEISEGSGPLIADLANQGRLRLALPEGG